MNEAAFAALKAAFMGLAGFLGSSWLKLKEYCIVWIQDKWFKCFVCESSQYDSGIQQ